MLFESIDLYAERWAKREQVNLKYLSEWKDRVKELVVDRISGLKEKFKSPKCKVLNQPDVKDALEKLHADFVLVPADKAASNVIIVCKKYYIETLVNELGINTTSNTNSTYILCTESFDDILRSRSNCMNSVGFEMSEEDKNHICTGLQNYLRPLLNIVLLLAPVNAQRKTCYAFLQSYYSPLKMDCATTSVQT